MDQPERPLRADAARNRARVLEAALEAFAAKGLSVPIDEIARLYAQRLQPEQIHRDCKNGHFVSGYALGHLGRMLPQRLQNLLFCVGLWFAFLILLAESDAATREWLIKRHWGLSLSTFGLDLVRFFEDRLPRAIKWALDWVHLAPLWAETGDS